MEEKAKIILEDVVSPEERRRKLRNNIILAVVIVLFFVFSAFGVWTILHNPPADDSDSPYQGIVVPHTAIYQAHATSLSLPISA
jgi:uncharacterized membrane protein SpoIIM required for sporulation